MFYSLIGSLGPKLHFNDGMRDVVRLRVRAAHHHQCRAARARSRTTRWSTCKLVDVILEALAQFHPGARHRPFRLLERAQHRLERSRGRASRPCSTRSSAPPMAAAWATTARPATATHLSNLHITPIEILESEFPCRITRFDLVPDSGGAGQWRGGLSMRREYELLEDATVIRRFDKTRFPPNGVAGGKPGSAQPLRRPARHPGGTETPRPAASRCRRASASAAERRRRRLRRSAPRDPAALARDLAEGYVTPQAAKDDYSR